MAKSWRLAQCITIGPNNRIMLNVNNNDNRTWARKWLTVSWRRSLSYRNQSTDLQSKPMDWFLYDKDLGHEWGNGNFQCISSITPSHSRLVDFLSLQVLGFSPAPGQCFLSLQPENIGTSVDFLIFSWRYRKGTLTYNGWNNLCYSAAWKENDELLVSITLILILSLE